MATLGEENVDLRTLGCFDNVRRIRGLQYDPNVHYDPIRGLCNHLIDAGHAMWARFTSKPYFRSLAALTASLPTIEGWNIPADAGFAFV